MEPVRKVEGIVAPLDRVDVDTDQIIPKQFLKRIARTGYGAFLFHDWRTREDGSPDPEFVLNRAPWDGARILVTGSNFGCGSSREHAAWALHDFGFRAVIAPSFADIFLSNCFQTGLVPVELPEPQVAALLDRAAEPDRDGRGPYAATVDLEAMRLTDPEGRAFAFELDGHRRRCLMEGLDDIDLTLGREAEIAAYEAEVGAPSWQA